MELADCNIMFVHITCKNNVLEDTISRLKTLNIYKDLLENLKTSVVWNMQENVMEICATDMHTIRTSLLHTEQKWKKVCKKVVSQICHGKKVASNQLLCLQVVAT